MVYQEFYIKPSYSIYILRTKLFSFKNKNYFNEIKKQYLKGFELSSRYLIFITLTLIFPLILSSIGETTAQISLSPIIKNAELSTYTDDTNGISLEYPSNWTKIESTNAIKFFSPPNQKYNDYGRVKLEVINSNNQSLEEFVNSYIKFRSKFGDFNLNQQSKVNINNHPASMLIFSSRDNNSKAENNIAIFAPINEKKIAMLHFRSSTDLYPIYIPVIEKMINSLHINPSQSSLDIIVSDNNVSKLNKLEDISHGIRIQFPSDWMFRLAHSTIGTSSIQQIVIFRPLFEKAVFSIGMENIDPSTSLKEYNNFIIDPVKQANNVTEQNFTTLSNKPAYKIIYNDEGVIGMKLWTISNNIAFVITIFANNVNLFNSLLPDIEKMINSFEIIPQSVSLENSTLDNSIKFVTYENTTTGIKIDHPVDWNVKESTLNISLKSLCILFVDCLSNYVTFNSPQEKFSDTVIEQVKISDFYINNIFFGKQPNLDKIAKVFIDDVLRYKESKIDYKPIESKQISLKDNSSAYMLSYQHTDPKKGVINEMDIFAINGKAGYWINIIIEPKKYSIYLPYIEKMINSFEIIPQSVSLENSTLDNSIKFVTYENTTTGIKIDHPVDWVEREVDLPPAMKKNSIPIEFIEIPTSRSDEFLEQVLLMSVSPMEKNAINESISNRIDEIRDSPSSYNININSSMAADIPFTVLDYMSDEKEVIHHIEFYGKRYDRIYSIDFKIQQAEFDNYLPIINKIVDSFQIPYILFSNATIGIDIQYPFDWYFLEGSQNDNITGFTSTLGSSYDNSIYFFSPDLSELQGSSEFIEVLIENLPSDNITLDSIINTTMQLNKESLGDSLKILDTNQTKLDGSDAYKITYSFPDDMNNNTKATQIITKNNQKMYTILYSAISSKYSEKTVNNFANSFKMK